MTTSIRVFMIWLASGMLLLALASHALAASLAPEAGPMKVELTIKDHKFSPDKLTLPAGQKIVLHVVNKDNSSEEFESRSLKREKIVTGGEAIDVKIGPLDAGTYEFFGDFHPDTAKGVITVTADIDAAPKP
ncbi:MAG TPA: cupredoxin domain-containing protein [Alphaproteobacteria bacterium]|nr:cupredoxin domain-containing protein [Alphaproteobacteria bacterium]